MLPSSRYNPVKELFGGRRHVSASTPPDSTPPITPPTTLSGASPLCDRLRACVGSFSAQAPPAPRAAAMDSCSVLQRDHRRSRWFRSRPRRKRRLQVRHQRAHRRPARLQRARRIVFDVAYKLSPRVDAVFSVGTARSSTRSEFRHWLDNDNLPIEQTTSFQRVPLTASLKMYLGDPGRSIGRFAWIPKRYRALRRRGRRRHVVPAAPGRRFHRFQHPARSSRIRSTRTAGRRPCWLSSAPMSL